MIDDPRFQPPPSPSDTAGGASPAVARFYSCRWHKPAEAQASAYCTHRDVLPMAGTTGFNAEAWCTDCQFHKLRRNPRKPAYS